MYALNGDARENFFHSYAFDGENDATLSIVYTHYRLHDNVSLSKCELIHPSMSMSYLIWTIEFQQNVYACVETKSNANVFLLKWDENKRASQDHLYAAHISVSHCIITKMVRQQNHYYHYCYCYCLNTATTQLINYHFFLILRLHSIWKPF